MPRAVQVMTYGFLGGTVVASFFLPRSITVPMMYASGPPAEITLTGMTRDFPGSHPDFDVVPADGLGHYAGNVATLLGDDGRPLQVQGVTDFVVSFGNLVPGVPYAARATVLGAEITSGGNPVPVTIFAETDTETFEPFGTYNDPAGAGDVNDGMNPREFVFSLTDVYSAETPIAITATSWLEGAGATEFGHESVFGKETSKADSHQLATQVTLAQSGTVTSISAYVKTSNGVVYGLYTDNAGEPGVLLAETSSADCQNDWGWFTRSIAPTWVPAGTYWLAISQDEGDQRIRHDDNGGQTRENNHDAENNGFQSTWSGTSDNWTWRLNIYATYTPDATYSEHMTVNSGVDSPYVEVLKNGDPVPAIPAFQSQASISTYVEDYVDVDSGLITLADNQAIYLFELGTTNLSSPSADFQDLVMLVTLATDPVYFFVPGTSTSGENPVGYKVDGQWTDSGGRNIAPHLYKPSQGDSVGVRGANSSGGVSSPATFYEWYRDVHGVNQSATTDITLTDTGSGVYEYHSSAFYPVDDKLYGNEGADHNHNFTFSMNTSFTYDAAAGQFLEFFGGDGCWIYVNGKLAIDLGGTQSGTLQYADFDRLGLVDGTEYEISLFYANRNPDTAEFHLRTNVVPAQGDILGTVTAVFD